MKDTVVVIPYPEVKMMLKQVDTKFIAECIRTNSR